ncbi:MAG: hypothetical protein ABI759_04975, partial [Candidatus Solibacter sp.]
MMQSGNRFVAIVGMTLLVEFCGGCGRAEPAPVRVAQPSTPAGNWLTVMPDKFAGLTVKDGGACYIDAFNDSAIGDGPIVSKSGAPASFAGWAVADLKGGLAGSAAGLRLNAAKPYFIGAGRYKRPGLGAALKGSPSLDDGGLKLDATPL